ncbi:MAG: cohesin domain-containing protein [Bacteroidota bacterium]
MRNYYLRLLVALGLLLSLNPIRLQAQGIIELESQSVPTNSTFTVAVEANGFNLNLATLDFTLEFDPTEVLFNNRIVNQNLPPLFGFSTPSSSQVKVTWTDFSLAGVAAASPTVLFELEFTLQSGVGSGSNVVIDYFVGPSNVQEVGLSNGSAALGTVFSPAVISVGTSFPVTWAGFEAKVERDRRVALNWTTAQEVNNDYFEVQRRTELTDWTSIGTVAGAGNSSQELTYEFVDPSPVGSELLYRIRQVDLDGAFDFSEVRRVSLDQQLGLRVYPSPAIDQVQVTLPAVQTQYEYAWFDGTGRILDQGSIEPTLDPQVALPVATLPTGSYTLMLKSPDGRSYRGQVLKQ